PSEYLYIVHRGRVRIYQLFASGKEHLLRMVEPGEFMGAFALFKENNSENYAEAMEQTEICMIHRQDVQDLMHQFATISVKVLEEISHRLEQTEKLIGALSAKDVEKRMASYLIELVEEKN